MPIHNPPSTEPEHIAVSKSKGVKIDWKDGHHSEYELRYLRDNCPCATCTGAHGSAPKAKPALSPFQMYQPALKITALEQLGSYAVQIKWNDGHKSGIYSYDHLREICPCADCAGG
jgi:DUF971 family protein